MTFEALSDVPVNILFGDGTHTNGKAGRGFRVEKVSLGHELVGLVKGVWAGDPQSSVEIKHEHLISKFKRVE